jgi:hypothetical protein
MIYPHDFKEWFPGEAAFKGIYRCTICGLNTDSIANTWWYTNELETSGVAPDCIPNIRHLAKAYKERKR